MCATTSTKFVQQLRDRLEWAYRVVQQVNEENKDTSYTMTVNIAVQNWDREILCY